MALVVDLGRIGDGPTVDHPGTGSGFFRAGIRLGPAAAANACLARWSRRTGPVAATGLIALLIVYADVRWDLGGVGSVAPVALLVLTVTYGTSIIRRSERSSLVLAQANRRLATTNEMLLGLGQPSHLPGDIFDLRRCAQSIAATAEATLGAGAVLVLEPTALAGRWRILSARGCATGEVLDVSSRSPLDDETDGQSQAAEIDMVVAALLGAAFPARICRALQPHDRQVGILVMAHPVAGHWDAVDPGLVSDLVELAGLMIDNSRRFNALWVVGATAERARIAHDLHDNLGQSIAALGLQMDILARKIDDPDLHSELAAIRGQVTGVVRQLRSTMRELRCDVTEDRALVDVLGHLVRDLNERAGSAKVELETVGRGRLGLATEHQLLLVARQAAITALTDAGADQVTITWCCDGKRGTLRVTHDAPEVLLDDLGSLATSAHLDALQSIEHRCRAIGARLETASNGSIGCEVGR